MSGVSAWAADSKWTDHYVKSVSEAVTSLENLNTGYYLLRNVGRKTFLKEEGTQLWLRNRTNGSDAIADVKTSFEGLNKGAMPFVVYITKNGNSYTMQFQSGNYIGKTLPHGSQASSDGTAGTLQFTHISGNQFAFGPVGSYWANGNGAGGYSEGSFTGWGGNAPTEGGGNDAYQLFPVQFGDCINCSFTATDGTNTLATMTYDYMSGDEVENHFDMSGFSYYYSNPSVMADDKVATSENRDFKVKFEVVNAPFQFSTAESPVWYTVSMRNNQSNHMLVCYKGDNSVTTGNNANNTPFTVAYLNGKCNYESFKGGLWAFVRDGAGVKVLNKLTGKFLTLAGASDMTNATLGEGTRLLVETNTSNGGSGFSLRYPGYATAHLGDHNGGKLAIWNNGSSQNDGGSSFKVALAENEDVIGVGKSVLNALLENMTAAENDAVYVTAVRTAEAIDAAKSAVSAATTLVGLDRAYEACELCLMPTFEEGAYYRIKNCNAINNPYLSTSHMFVGTDGTLAASYNKFGDYSSTDKTNGVNRQIHRVTESDALVPQLWQFVENVGYNTYKVKNANTGCRMSSYAAPIDMPVNVNAGGDYSFKVVPYASFEGNDGKTMFQMYVDGHMINAFGGGNDNIIKEYNYINDKGGYWQFIKVTEIPVTISAAGWASVALPCAVQVPSDVKAYYAKTVNGNSMTLEEIEDGIVPANTGVLLAKEGGASVNLAIVSTDKTIEGNLLQPATAKRAGFDAQSTYVLARDGEDGDIAFLVSDLTTVPANKAYLNASAVPASASVLSFTFGGAETGINDAIAEDSNETYYDLNGRVVLYPHNGIYVTKSGKKLFIK